MTDPTQNSDETLKKLSRRNMLRNSAITATGVALLPTFITGCHKDVYDIIKGHIPKGGVGGVELTPAELKNAADNLNRMRDLLTDLYNEAFKYDVTVLTALESTTQNESWANFFVDIVIDIAIGMAAAAALATGNAEVIPALAFVSSVLHDWGIGKGRPLDLSGVNGFFTNYENGQRKMHGALDEHLGSLTDETDNYADLRAAWNEPIVFNGQTYTLAHLAALSFPDKENHANEYYRIYNPMNLHHQKSVWNLAIMKCCTLYRHYADSITTATTPAGVLLSWARNDFYPENKGSYLRAEMNDYDPDAQEISWWIYKYDLGIGGNPFPDAAAAILFMDDTPGHIINPDGLFPRDYVFKQFSFKKPVFEYGHELGNDQVGNLNPSQDDWDFTGGLFPVLADIG